MDSYVFILHGIFAEGGTMNTQGLAPDDATPNEVKPVRFELRWNAMNSTERDNLFKAASCLQLELQAEASNTRPSTLNEYSRTLKRLYAKKTVVIKSRSRLRILRAAILYEASRRVCLAAKTEPKFLCQQVAIYLALQESLKSPAGPLEGQKCEDQAFCRIGRLLTKQGFQLLGPDRPNFPARKGRVTKLKQYPADWRERVLMAITTEIPGLKESVLLLSLLGCRPCEIPSATVCFTDNNTLQITVVSVKGLGGLGGKDPVVRGAIYPINDLTEPLCKLADDHSIPFAAIEYKQIANVLQRTGQKKGVFPKLKRPSVASSDFRNQLASDCKAAGFSGEELALLLGHISNKQQKVYGRSIRGGAASPYLPLEVLQSHEVREIRSRYQSRPFSARENSNVSVSNRPSKNGDIPPVQAS